MRQAVWTQTTSYDIERFPNGRHCSPTCPQVPPSLPPDLHQRQGARDLRHPRSPSPEERRSASAEQRRSRWLLRWRCAGERRPGWQQLAEQRDAAPVHLR